MPRTTLRFDPGILRELRLRAAREGTSVQAVANRLLREALSRPHPSSYRLELDGWSAEERPGVDLCDRDRLFDLMDGR
ncbi:MAG: hypothetical protein AB7I33_02470 [Gemmatimonadales bacterium]